MKPLPCLSFADVLTGLWRPERRLARVGEHRRERHGPAGAAERPTNQHHRMSRVYPTEISSVVLLLGPNLLAEGGPQVRVDQLVEPLAQVPELGWLRWGLVHLQSPAQTRSLTPVRE